MAEATARTLTNPRQADVSARTLYPKSGTKAGEKERWSKFACGLKKVCKFVLTRGVSLFAIAFFTHATIASLVTKSLSTFGYTITRDWGDLFSLIPTFFYWVAEKF